MLSALVPKSHFRAPPCVTDDQGKPRRVGVEVEFAAVSVAEAAEMVKELYGGEIVPTNRFGVTVKDTKFGDFRVELDATILLTERYKELCQKIGVGDEGQETVGDALEAIMKKFVPNEIVCPPIELGALEELEALRERLHRRGALGTRASLLYAFGFQLNPEAPSLEAGVLRDHLAAFLLLYEWILEVSEIDLTRKIAPFIDAFPEEYRALVVDPEYRPNLDKLIDDYLLHNPTRNRPVDMLPLFAHLDEAKVRAALPENEKVNKRPTFHYRLPNCLIDEPDWTFATEWNRWVEIEKLAADTRRLNEMGSAYLELSKGPFRLHKRRWAKEAAEYVGLKFADSRAG